MTDPDH